jgi:hypothetical protein
MEHQPDEIHPDRYGKSCYWRDPGPRPRCPDCGGSGSILLLVSKRPCDRCGGTGFIERPEPVYSLEVDVTPVAAEAAAEVRIDLPPVTEWPPPILSTYTYEADVPVPVGENRLTCKDGQWWEEQFVLADGHWQLVSRAPTTPPPGLWPRQ